VDDRHAYAVQAARHLVRVLVELAAGVKHSQSELDTGDLLRRVEIDGEPTPVVDHGDRIIRVDDDVDRVRVTGERLVDRVVYYLVYEVVETPRARGPDVHPGPLPDRFQTLEYLD